MILTLLVVGNVVDDARIWGRCDGRKRGHRFVVVQSAVPWVLMLGRVSMPRLRSR